MLFQILSNPIIAQSDSRLPRSLLQHVTERSGIVPGKEKETHKLKGEKNHNEWVQKNDKCRCRGTAHVRNNINLLIYVLPSLVSSECN